MVAPPPKQKTNYCPQPQSAQICASINLLTQLCDRKQNVMRLEVIVTLLVSILTGIAL